MLKTKDTLQHNKVSNIFETEWFSLEAISYPTPNQKPYYRLSCNDSVTILAKTVEDKIILVRQYRPAISAFTIEPPSGYLDDKESSEDAIKRELLEETGYTCEQISYMGSLKICPSRINNSLHVFFGKDAKLTGMKSNEDKGAELVLVTCDEFKKLILNGGYIETAGIAMLFMSQLNGYL